MVTGTLTSEVESWLGIEYAVAERFAAPERLSFSLAGRYERYGAAPFQIEDPNQPLGAEPAERCHFLNVWSPADRTRALPVVVGVYGGGFEHGAASSWVMDGTRIAATGRALFVSFNYRVGALGFLTADHLGDRFADATNLGLRDVICALEWVRQEIHRFGGDPNQVTVVGESAGGFLATALAAAPAAAGLFHRLAIHSAGASRILPLTAARSMADALIAHLGLDEPDDLIRLDAADLTRGQSAVTATDIGVRNGPVPRAFGVVDDSTATRPVLSAHPLEAIAQGALRSVPLLVSSMQDEIALFRDMAAADFDPNDEEAIIDEIAGWGVSRERAAEVLESIVAEHPHASPGHLRAAVLTDYIYRLPAARLAVAATAAGGTAYLQMIGITDGVPAGHAMDVPALVGAHWPDSSTAARARDEAIFDAVMDFATSGTPGWEAAAGELPAAHDVAELREPAAKQYAMITQRWNGIARP